MLKSFFGDEDKKLGEDLSEAMSEGTEETSEVPSEEVVEVTPIKLGEKEYSPDELEELVSLGSKAIEIGENHGGFDKYVSEYGKKSQKIGDLNKEIETLKSGSSQAVDPSGAMNDEAMAQAQEAARKLGLVLTPDLKKEVASILDSEFSNLYQSRRSGEKLLEDCSELAGEITGEDGRPKFQTEKVLEFMQENPGFKSPKRAYEAMNLDTIAEWKVNKLMNIKGKGISTNTDVQANKTPQGVKVTNANLGELMSEQINMP